MYYLTGVIAAGYALLALTAYRSRSVRENIPAGMGKIWKPFYYMAFFLAEKPHGGLRRIFRNRSVQKRLERLYPMEDVDALMRGYYVKKISLLLAVLLAGTLLGCLVHFQALRQTSALIGNKVQRGSFEQGDRLLTLNAVIGDTEEYTFEINVKGQIPEYERAEKLEEQFWEKLKKFILGENEAADKIWKNLNLPAQIENYPFHVEWHSSRPDILDDYGWVNVPQEGEEHVSLTAIVRYEKWEWEHELLLTVVPPQQTASEKQFEALNTFLKTAEEQSREDSQWSLPLKWEGKRIRWEEQRTDSSLAVWLIILAAAAAVYLAADQDLDKKIAEKQQKMKEAYPAIVNRLLLYLGAGMSMRAAFYKIADHYNADVAAGKNKHPAYEEIVYACREMQAGIPEANVYERLGQRSGLQEYVRFGALLGQNLRKGSGMLLERLGEEAARSQQEQMSRYRQRGEVASTKLLVPMAMMLGIVMLMIMLPAFGAM